jgi:hypothetical protein
MLDRSWSEVDSVEEIRGVLPMSNGVALVISGKRLIWWCPSPDMAEKLMGEVSRYIPGKVVHRKRPKMVL